MQRAKSGRKPQTAYFTSSLRTGKKFMPPSSGTGHFPEDVSFTFRHRQQADLALYPSLQKSIPVLQHG